MTNAKLYYFYKMFPIKILRLGIFLLLILLILFFIQSKTKLKQVTFLLSIFLLFEVFFRFKISKQSPRSMVPETKVVLDAFTLEALSIFSSNNKATGVIKNLMHTPTVIFMLEKSDILASEIQFIEIEK